MPRNSAPNRVVLLPAAAPRGAAPAAAGAAGAAPIRRYRLARLQPGIISTADRFAHLRRAYD